MSDPLEVATPLRPLAYSPAQAAQVLPIAESSIRRLVREGKIHARYFGSSILIDADALTAFYHSLPTEKQVERECAANRHRPQSVQAA